MQCSSCQQTVPPEARFCPSCGVTLFPTAPPPDPLLGTVIGERYRIQALLAEGGMGRVYIADQPMGNTIRKVAIKVVPESFAANPSIIERFMRECGVVCELSHPNTIKFFDYGKTQQNDVYIVMEYVEGEPLSTVLLHQGALLPERVLRILNQLCGSLQEAHDKNIIHRDIKPDNILITPTSSEPDFVKLLDFGIARRLYERDRRLTPLGQVLGSPPYMSPEQFCRSDIDARSDIYSLAVVTYEMLTGQLPFVAQEALAWATMHMTAPPIAFQKRPLRYEIPECTQRAVMRALSKAPSDRPQSMREFFREMSSGPMTSPSNSPPGISIDQESRAPRHGTIPLQKTEPEPATMRMAPTRTRTLMDAPIQRGTTQPLNHSSVHPPKTLDMPSRPNWGWWVGLLGALVLLAGTLIFYFMTR